MAGALHGVLASLKAAAASATDAFFRYVSLLLNTTSTNGAQNNTFLDSSTNAFSITRNGNTTQGTFSPFSQTGWSNFFDGSGDYLTVPAGSAFAYGTANFTLEAWVFPTVSGSNGVIFSQTISGTNYFVLVQDVANTVSFIFATSGGGTYITPSTPLTINAWNHVAVCRTGTGTNQTTVYLNGVGTSGTCAQDFTNTTYVPTIGRYTHSASLHFNGYISNLRIVNGTAVYTANFTPPTAPLTAITNTSLLTCQSNRFIDNSSNAFAITRNGDVSVQAFSPFSPTAAWSASTNGGSGYFDGTGDYLTTPTTTALSFGTGDFTVECWVYKTTATNSSIIDGRVNPGAAAPWAFYVDASNFPYFYEGTIYTSSVAVSLNAWTHVAATRSAGTLKIFVNGVQGFSATVTTNLDRTAGSFIGAAANTVTPQAFYQGFMCDLRVVKGTAVYTAAFTPPTAPLTAITNTSLLLNFTNAGIYDSASGNDLETVGNAQVSTVQAKWGTTSMAFDGTGDWLVVPASPRWDFGSGDFTVEMWLNPSSTTTTDAVISKGNVSSTGNEVWTLQWFGTNQLAFFSGGGLVSPVVNTTTQFSTGTWYHVAVTRSGTTTRIFVNGTQEASSTTSYTVTAGGSLYVGAGWFAPASRDTSGYIDDLRITNGVARYTSNFTAPTAAFPLQ